MFSKGLSKYRGGHLSSLTTRAAAACTTLAMLGMAAGTASASVIYSDSFPGSSSSPLNGTSPATDATGATWNAPTAPIVGGWAADGSTTNTAVGGNQAAYLSFTPTSGNVYTLSATLNPTGNSGNWLGLGFSTTNSTPFYTNGGPWMYLAGNGGMQTFSGPGVNGVNTPATQPIGETAEVVLNTQASQWTAQWYYNGSSLDAPIPYGTGANPSGITAVGINTNSEPGSVGMFSLTSLVPVPEPATLGLFAIGGAGLLLAARKRKTQA